MSDPIQIWQFYDAPKELRELSPHGGDEDWLALIPANLAQMDIRWLEEGVRVGFGVCDVSTHPLPDGRVVKIGAHA